MPELDPEVIDVLDRLARGELTVSGHDKTELYRLASALINARESLAQVLTEINRQGDNFSTIGAQLGIHEATAARWAKPPAEDRRRRPRPSPGE